MSYSDTYYISDVSLPSEESLKALLMLYVSKENQPPVTVQEELLGFRYIWGRPGEMVITEPGNNVVVAMFKAGKLHAVAELL